jgi:hypothetical protein
MARRIEDRPDELVVGYSDVSALTRLTGEVRIPYDAIRSVTVGLDENEVPSALSFRLGLSTAPFGRTRQGQFWWAGRRVFLDFRDPDRAVVLELAGHRFARVAFEPETRPETLAEAIRTRVSASRP